jgi:hypothetical protein
VTGRAGDVFVCHPFLVHAASWPHAGRQPRIMAQPGVALHDAFPLAPPLSPVEPAMAGAASSAGRWAQLLHSASEKVKYPEAVPQLLPGPLQGMSL